MDRSAMTAKFGPPVLTLALLLLAGSSGVVRAQGVVQGIEQGSQAGNKAAGPVGGVLGGAIGGMVGVFTGVLGVPANNNTVQQPVDSARAPAQPAPATAPAQPAKDSKPAKTAAKPAAKTAAKAAKSAKAAPPAPVAAAPAAPPPSPEITAEQIVANSDANIARIKAELNLTPDQEKHWTAFNSAMHYLGHNGADRLNLRIARAKRDPPDDIVEQMRNEAQFLYDRAQDQRSVADAADPLFASLDAKQKAIFIEEMVRLSRERGLD
jgi:hypothetical protein